MMGGTGSWTTCKSFAPRFRQTTTPTPHHSVFTGRVLFLTPNEQYQSTEGNWKTNRKYTCGHRSLQTRLLQLSTTTYRISDYTPPTDSELSSRAVVIAPKSCDISPVLRSLHWLTITERVEYKLISLTKSSKPSILYISITSFLFNLLALHLSLP